YSEAKATGFEPKIMRQIVRMRAMDRDLLSEQDALLDTYRDALGLR
ncbi:MAG: GapR family DNA-binding domain-containing protein, partial [Candidatus Puniceispirillum sp.]